MGCVLIPAEPIEIHLAAGRKLDAFVLEKLPLEFVGARVGPVAHAAIRAKDSMPRHIRSAGQGAQGEADVPCMPRKACDGRDLAIGGDPSPRDSSDDCAESLMERK